MTELDLLRKKLREAMNNIADDIAGGVAIDFPHYKELVGQISGLALAERELLDLQERMSSSEYSD